MDPFKNALADHAPEPVLRKGGMQMKGTFQKVATHQEVLETFTRMPIIARISTRLAGNLAENLRYHCAQHSLDVLSDTLLFALHDGVEERMLELLGIAAAYHDAGYLERYALNEPIGAAIAAEAMRAAGSYSEAEIHEVEEMILSTQLLKGPEGFSRVAHTPHSAYLLDADLGAFGRDDFWEKCRQLCEETGAEPQAFDHQTLEMLSTHVWFTPAAKVLRAPKMHQNLKELEAKLAATA